MKRAVPLLMALLAVLLVVVAFIFLIKPKMDEATELREQADSVRAQQAQVRNQIAALEQVRATSPNLEAELATIAAIIPNDPALPSALRQLQSAADASGVTLVSVSPSPPASMDDPEIPPELAAITFALQVEGGYFQVVDFLRRIENPLITARGMLIRDVAIGIDEYPTLSVTVSGAMFARLAGAAPPPPPPPTDDDAEDEDDDLVGEDG